MHVDIIHAIIFLIIQFVQLFRCRVVLFKANTVSTIEQNRNVEVHCMYTVVPFLMLALIRV